MSIEEIHKVYAAMHKEAKATRQQKQQETWRQYRIKHKERLGQQERAYKKAHPEMMRKSKAKCERNKPEQYRNARRRRQLLQTLREYGITIADLKECYIKQNGCCAICKIRQPDLLKRLCIDHCHSSGKFRGLLCDSCNVGLGNFKDSAERLKAAIDYLKSAPGGV